MRKCSSRSKSSRKKISKYILPDQNVNVVEKFINGMVININNNFVIVTEKIDEYGNNIYKIKETQNDEDVYVEYDQKSKKFKTDQGVDFNIKVDKNDNVDYVLKDKKYSSIHDRTVLKWSLINFALVALHFYLASSQTVISNSTNVSDLNYNFGQQVSGNNIINNVHLVNAKNKPIQVEIPINVTNISSTTPYIPPGLQSINSTSPVTTYFPYIPPVLQSINSTNYTTPNLTIPAILPWSSPPPQQQIISKKKFKFIENPLLFTIQNLFGI